MVDINDINNNYDMVKNTIKFQRLFDDERFSQDEQEIRTSLKVIETLTAPIGYILFSLHYTLLSVAKMNGLQFCPSRTPAFYWLTGFDWTRFARLYQITILI